jgi:hypothetical protein
MNADNRPHEQVSNLTRSIHAKMEEGGYETALRWTIDVQVELERLLLCGDLPDDHPEVKRLQSELEKLRARILRALK